MRRASKGYTRVDIPLFPTMLVQGPILQGEGSTVLVESHHTPSGAPKTSQPPLSSPSRIPIKQETKVPQPSSPTHTNVADEATSIGVDVRHRWAATTVSSLDTGQGSDNIHKTSSMPYDSPLPRVHTLRSDEGRMQSNELMDLVTKLSDRVLALETDLQQTKKVYSTAVTKLIIKVKKLEKIVKSSKARRRAKIVVSDDEEDVEDTSKQGWSMIEDIDQDAGVTLVQIDAENQGRFEDETDIQVSAHGEAHSQGSQPEDQLGVFSAAKVLADAARVHTYTTRRRIVSTGSGRISTASRLISTAEESVSTAGDSMPVSTTGMVQESIPSPRATKDKGKAFMTESKPEQTTTKLKQRQERARYEAVIRLQEQLDEDERQRIARDAEVAQKLQEEIDAAERQKMAQVHQAAQGFTDAEWDDILARVAVDEDLVKQLQAGEKCSEDDLPMKLVELVNQRKKFFAQQRAEQRRNKPMTQAQQRTYMCNYIKNMGSHTLQQLKKLSLMRSRSYLRLQ
ncbi:hypothetical protein Tco_0657591 [Tanacetum coccineum]